jgi:hypothetical protein
MEKNVKNFGFTRNNILRIISLTVILAFIMPVMTNAQAGKANFAGTWAMNAAKSDQPPAGGAGGGGGQGGGGGMRGGLSNFVATQEANLLTVVSSRTGQDGTTVTTTSKYTLDGKESLNTTPGFGGGDPIQVPSVATWSADGKSLTIVTTRTFNDQTMKTTQVWTLTDASTLSITTTSPGFQGGAETVRKRVYDKK